MIKGAIFDLDGTLLDSMFIWDTIGEEYLRSLGKEPHEDLKETFMTLTLEEAAEYYREHYGVTLSVKEIVDGVNAMVEQTYRTKVTLKPGISEYLAWLKGNGVRMCVATVTDRYLVEETLDRLGVRHYFSEIFTCAEVGFGKDKPIIYQKALEHLGTAKDETYVFEDMLFALNTAKTDGFPTVGVYDRHEEHQDELKELADYYIFDFTDPILKTI
jgi:HAD superfamily hydrolase (TIGR01509 family)